MQLWAVNEVAYATASDAVVTVRPLLHMVMCVTVRKVAKLRLALGAAPGCLARGSRDGVGDQRKVLLCSGCCLSPLPIGVGVAFLLWSMPP
jgi:hypothetical protein